MPKKSLGLSVVREILRKAPYWNEWMRMSHKSSWHGRFLILNAAKQIKNTEQVLGKRASKEPNLILHWFTPTFRLSKDNNSRYGMTLSKWNDSVIENNIESHRNEASFLIKPEALLTVARISQSNKSHLQGSSRLYITAQSNIRGMFYDSVCKNLSTLFHIDKNKIM